MRKLYELLFAFWVLLYMSLVDNTVKDFFSKNWLKTAIILSGIVFMLIVSSFISRKTSDFLKNYIPTVIYDLDKMNGFFYAILLMFSICLILPILLIKTIERFEIFSFGSELNIFTSLTLSSMLITFNGKWIVSVLNKYVVDNPSKKAESLSQNIVSEEVIKVVIFTIYFFLLIMSAIVKYKHLKIWILDEDSVPVLILAFTTFIALDRIVTTSRKIKDIKFIDITENQDTNS